MKILILVLLYSVNAFANEDRPGWWFGTFARTKVSSQLIGSTEIQVRNRLDNGTVDQMLFRTGLHHAVGRHEFAVLLGVIQNPGKLERRYAVQHVMPYFKTPEWDILHRMRVEWRDFAKNDNDALRFRFMLRASRVLGSVKALVWNELFMNLSNESSVGQNFIERNRFFAGVELPVSARVEVGYLNQHAPRTRHSITDHLAVIYWYF